MHGACAKGRGCDLWRFTSPDRKLHGVIPVATDSIEFLPPLLNWIRVLVEGIPNGVSSNSCFLRFLLATVHLVMVFAPRVLGFCFWYSMAIKANFFVCGLALACIKFIKESWGCKVFLLSFFLDFFICLYLVCEGFQGGNILLL